MRLVYLSPVPWDSFAQRPHKFVEWFHRRTGQAVLWVDPYPTRFPNWRDLLSPRPSPSSSKTQDAELPAWLTLLQPSGLPIEPIPGSGWVNGMLWLKHRRAISKFAAGGKTLLVIGKPSAFALDLLSDLPDCQSLYDAMDDFPAFYTGVSRLALMRRERAIARRVHIILASSSELKSRWESLHKDVRLVHNGLDLTALQTVNRAASPSNKTVFGYVGTIASWFDWKWLCTLAEIRSKDEIHIIGPLFDQPDCKLPINVHLMPARDHLSALNAMTQFHVGLIPFENNSLTASVDPIKYYEYRALGLPVISTDFGEMSLRADERGVFITKSMSDIFDAARSAIQFCEDPNGVNTFAMQNTWEARFDEADLLR